MKDVECPYCGADIEINHDDGYGFEEDKIHEQQCSFCKKTFAYLTSISFSYKASKADCLNGGDHRYKLTVTHPPEFAGMRCEGCGREAPAKANHEHSRNH